MPYKLKGPHFQLPILSPPGPGSFYRWCEPAQMPALHPSFLGAMFGIPQRLSERLPAQRGPQQPELATWLALQDVWPIASSAVPWWPQKHPKSFTKKPLANASVASSPAAPSSLPSVLS